MIPGTRSPCEGENAMKLSLRYVYSIPDRHGNARLYFWRGKGRIRIREEFGSVGFAERYDALLRGERSARQRHVPHKQAPQ